MIESKLLIILSKLRKNKDVLNNLFNYKFHIWSYERFNNSTLLEKNGDIYRSKNYSSHIQFSLNSKNISDSIMVSKTNLKMKLDTLQFCINKIGICLFRIDVN